MSGILTQDVQMWKKIKMWNFFLILILIAIIIVILGRTHGL